MTLLGMDTAAGLAASDQIDAGSQQIADLARRLDDVLHRFEWVGPDADETRDTWNGSARPDLDATSAHLASLAVLLRREAGAQDTASGDGSGAPVAGVAAGTSTAVAPTSWLGRLGRAVTDRLGAVFSGLGRTLGHAGGLAEKIGDVLTGRENWSVSEIAASAIATAGAGVGTLVNAVTGEDERWFGEGAGEALTPVPAGGAHPLVPPTDLGSLMDGVTAGYAVGHEGTGDVRITTVTQPDGSSAYVVAVPGTDRWGPDATAVLRDLSANVALVADEPTAAAESVRRAMDAAGIPAGAQVLMVGHSQGGIVTGQLASDPAFASRYRLSMLTYGAPIDHMQLQPGVHALQLQHAGDIVPRLDLGGYGAGWEAYPNTEVPGVVLASPEGGLGANHDYRNYASSVRHAIGTDTPEGRRLREFQDGLGAFLVRPGGSATAVDVPVRRGP